MCDHFFPFLILVRHGVLCLRSLLACFHHHFCLHINGHPRDQEQDLSGDQKAHGCPHGQEVRQRTGRQSATGERWVVTVLEKVARGPPLTHIVMALAMTDKGLSKRTSHQHLSCEVSHFALSALCSSVCEYLWSKFWCNVSSWTFIYWTVYVFAKCFTE